MHAHYFFITLSLFVAVDSYSMDKKLIDVVDWYILACNLYRDTTSLFSQLPADVQANIFSRISPKTILDDWQINDAVCVQTIKIPYPVITFDVSGDRMAYLAPRPNNAGFYDTHWVDLNTTKNHQIAQHGSGEVVQKIALCGNKIIVQSKKNLLFALDIYDRGVGLCKTQGTIVSGVEVRAWKCHPKLPKCIVIDDSNFVKTYEIQDGDDCKCSDKYAKLVRATNETDKSFGIQWHPSEQEVAFTYRKELRFEWGHGFNALPCHSDLHAYLSLLDEENVDEYEPQFTFNERVIYAQYGDKLVKYHANPHNNDVGGNDTGMDMSDKILRGVGDKALLIEHKKEHSIGDKTYEMRIIIADILQPGIRMMTTFNNPKGLHKLPTLDDQRYITVEPDNGGGSKISIYLPKSRACFQHYCMFQAGLAAEKSWQAVDLHLFKRDDSKQIVRETAEYYAYFKKLMQYHKVIKE